MDDSMSIMMEYAENVITLSTALTGINSDITELGKGADQSVAEGIEDSAALDALEAAMTKMAVASFSLTKNATTASKCIRRIKELMK